MERHVFKFGRSSFALVLPKKWVDKTGLKKSNTVFVSETAKGDLMVSSREHRNREANLVIDPKTSPKLVGRWVWHHYIYGASKVRLYSKSGLSKPQIDEVEVEISKEAPGFEIISQSSNEIVIEDFTDLNEVSIDKVISRIRSLVAEELREATKDYIGVSKIEDLVDRFYSLGLRYINIAQPEDPLKYFRIIELLELISDEIYAITKSEVKNPKIFEYLSRQFELAFSGLGGDLNSIEAASILRESILNLIKDPTAKKPETRYFKNMATYIAQIAEFGLDIQTHSDTMQPD